MAKLSAVMAQQRIRAMTETAKQLRRELTPAEARIWDLVRNRRCGGYRFLRQAVAAHFVLDFYCPTARLAIEVDGSVHESAEVARCDKERETLLREEMHITILRLSNDEVLSANDSMLHSRILYAISQAEQIAPPPGQRPARHI